MVNEKIGLIIGMILLGIIGMLVSSILVIYSLNILFNTQIVFNLINIIAMCILILIITGISSGGILKIKLRGWLNEKCRYISRNKKDKKTY